MSKDYRYRKALVLETSDEPRSILTTERAFAIVYKGNAVVVKEHPIPFGIVRKDITIMKPSIIRRTNGYKNVPHRSVSLSRKNIFARDEHTCVYCGSKNRQTLTIDHVVPKAHGGRDTWENLVTACFDCNQEKADLTVEEWGMPDPKPRRPHYLLLMKKSGYIPPEWKKYLTFG